MTVISYPIPPYQNVPIKAGYYQPSQFFITGIALGRTTTITTAAPMNYVVGQEIRLIIPPSFGCRQLNGKTGYVLTIVGANQVVVSIDSSQNVDPFILSSATTAAQILAIGDINNGTIGSQIGQVPAPPGSFINISPV